MAPFFAAMDEIDSEMLEALIARLNSGHWDEFLSQGEGCNWCRHPVRIRGVIAEGDIGDRSLRFSTDSLPDGVFLKALWLETGEPLPGLCPHLPA